MENTQLQLHEPDSDFEIDLSDLLYLFRQKLIGILIATVLGGLIVGLFTFFFIPPKYEATAKLYIVSASNDSVVNLSDLQIGASLTADYEELVLSRPMLESIISNLSLEDITVDGLKAMITISNPGDTRILNITATSVDPVQAEQIANELATLALSWLPEIMESNTPNLAEEAIVPEQKASPSYVLNTLVGAFIGMALYYGVAVFRFVYDDTVRSAEELERYFGVVPLVMIPEEEGVRDNDEESHSSKKHGRAAGLKRLISR